MKNRMKNQSLLFAALCAGVLSSCARADVTRVEAETKLASGDAKILELPEASGGKAVSIARDWQPLLIAPLPAQGDVFTIWVRYRDKPILIKANLKDGQKDLGWQWDSPTTLTWKKAGRWKREEIGENLIVIRGGDGGQGPVLDCVVFSTNENYDPNADKSTPAQAEPEKAAPKNDANINEGAALALGMQDAPKGEFFEAENFKANGEVVAAQGASGGKAVKSGGDWQPIISIPLPAGDAWKVWIRHKGGPMAIKTKTGDRWFWNKPNQWEWRETDVFSREDLGGTNLVIGRDAGGPKTDTAQIDAVVLSPEKKRDVPEDKPDEKIAPEKIAASIDWSKSAGVLAPELWGINEQQILDPKNAGDAVYQKLLGELKPPLLRIHQADLVSQWTNEKNQDWDVEKIQAAFKNSTGYGDAKIMLCISELPSWIANGHPAEMSEGDEDAFAAFCARLVKIMRDDVKRKIDYWEISNEWDNSMEKAGRLENYWRIYNKCAAEMRVVDPKAKLGGPAFTWAKPLWVNGFLENCPDAQFISWHNYATGDLYDTNQKVFAQVNDNVGSLASGVLAALKKHNRKLETFLTETNVKYTWDPYERRHQNAVGSVFHALVVQKMASLGVSGVTLWTQKGTAYGSIIDGENKTFPSYNLYRWGSEYLSGKMARAVSGDHSKLEIIAVTRADGNRAVVLLNKTNHALTLPASGVLLPAVKAVQTIDTSGYKANVAITANELSLPGFSLTLLSSRM